MSLAHRSIPVGVIAPPAEAENQTKPTTLTLEGVNPSGVYQTPLIDIHEGADGLILEADLPGGNEEDVSIQLADNVLTLHVKIKPNLPEGAVPLHEEYRPTDFFRSFILSDEVDRSKITADLKNGVLRLILPKADRAKSRRIEIKS